ncbi:MAG: hypothetical protein RIR70_355 [Pseudomonadota bacterium]|jgi:hypothetical protein
MAFNNLQHLHENLEVTRQQVTCFSFTTARHEIAQQPTCFAEIEINMGELAIGKAAAGGRELVVVPVEHRVTLGYQKRAGSGIDCCQISRVFRGRFFRFLTRLLGFGMRKA